MTELRLDTPVQYLRGVGPARAALFEKLGVRTVRDLLRLRPRAYEADQGHVPIGQLKPDTQVTIRGKIIHARNLHPGFVVEVDDGTGRCVLRWFQQRPGGWKLYIGAGVEAQGLVEAYNGRPSMVHPAIRVFPLEQASTLAPRAPQQRAVYREVAGLPSHLIRKAIAQVLPELERLVPEILPEPLLTRRRLCGRASALQRIHAPQTSTDPEAGRRRLAFDELLMLELALALRRRRSRALAAARRLPISREMDQRIRQRFPFELTDWQNKVIREISADLAAEFPMTRLLQGDVGSGKTAVALYACLAAVAHGYQAAIMAPTELLARQHYEHIERYLAGSRVRRMLLAGRGRPNERASQLGQVERGDVDLVVGTQALVQKGVTFRELAVAVIDEQHKFGVVQRALIRSKGMSPHYLVMTATPIPRTLAMTVFGDLDVSVLAGRPPGRGAVETIVESSGRWRPVVEEIGQRLRAGEQAFVVCPRLGADAPGGGVDDVQGLPDAAELRSARTVFDELTTGPWRDLPIGLVYGPQPPDEKQAVMNEFAAGRLRALVATTVIEVGVDVPGATIMLVDHAERFGLSQLHQLRGRVGRGQRLGVCILMNRSRNPGVAARLEVLSRSSNGFEIAEADLALRGPGEVLGTRQHGLPELWYANLVEDEKLIEAAREEAQALALLGEKLREPAFSGLLAATRRLVGRRLALIDAA